MRPEVTPCQSAILAALEKIGRSATYYEIAELAGVSEKTMRSIRYIPAMRKKGLIRVSRWKRNYGTSGRPIPYFVIADGKPDAKPPKPLTVAERSKRHAKKVNRGRNNYLKHGIPHANVPPPANPVAVIDPLLGLLLKNSLTNLGNGA